MVGQPDQVIDTVEEGEGEGRGEVEPGRPVTKEANRDMLCNVFAAERRASVCPSPTLTSYT